MIERKRSFGSWVYRQYIIHCENKKHKTTIKNKIDPNLIAVKLVFDLPFVKNKTELNFKSKLKIGSPVISMRSFNFSAIHFDLSKVRPNNFDLLKIPLYYIMGLLLLNLFLNKEDG